MNNQLFNEDCFAALDKLPDRCVDLVCTDPPYGTTTMAWDKVLDFGRLWTTLARVCKPTANIIIFGSQPFSSLVVASKIDWFKYELIWNKNKCGSPGLAKYRPQKVHENILVFAQQAGTTYNPIMEAGEPYKREAKDKENGYGKGRNNHGYGFSKFFGGENHGTRYPKSILHASRNFSAQQTVHPTQKPTNLLNWLIMTYSNPGDTVLDFTMGSGSCGVSAKMCGRRFIGIERDPEYFRISKMRIDEAPEDFVTPSHFQLTTQLSEDMDTMPEKRYEDKILGIIREGMDYKDDETDV